MHYSFKWVLLCIKIGQIALGVSTCPTQLVWPKNLPTQHRWWLAASLHPQNPRLAGTLAGLSMENQFSTNPTVYTLETRHSLPIGVVGWSFFVQFVEIKMAEFGKNQLIFAKSDNVRTVQNWPKTDRKSKTSDHPNRLLLLVVTGPGMGDPTNWVNSGLGTNPTRTNPWTTLNNAFEKTYAWS